MDPRREQYREAPQDGREAAQEPPRRQGGPQGGPEPSPRQTPPSGRRGAPPGPPGHEQYHPTESYGGAMTIDDFEMRFVNQGPEAVSGTHPQYIEAFERDMIAGPRGVEGFERDFLGRL